VLCTSSILETAKAAGNFQTLVAALEAANLADTMNSAGSFTVFAPIDAAFDSLLSDLGIDAAALLGKGAQFLGNILTYHVGSGVILSSDLQDRALFQSLQGGRLLVRIANNVVSIGNAQVTTANIACTNGVIHVIDAVLMPPPVLTLHGGDVGWNANDWTVVNDGVMGGRSNGYVKYDDNTMIFTGSINLVGGGFTSVRARKNLDLSAYAGLVVVTGASDIEAIHVTISDASGYGFAAPVPLPASSSSASSRVLLPWAAFDYVSRGGWNGCSSCSLDVRTITEITIYILFLEGPFELKIKEVSAVKALADGPGQPSALPYPRLQLDTAVVEFIQETTSRGGSLFNKGYRGMCEVMYASALQSILATAEAPPRSRGVACAGLMRGMIGTRTEKAFKYRRAMDVITADINGQNRPAAGNYPAAAQGLWPEEAPTEATKECLLMLYGHSGFKSIPSLGSAEDIMNVPIVVDQTGGAVEYFLGPFVAMGISDNNDYGLVAVSGPRECAQRCLQEPKCRSFDYGARDRVQGDCWMSKADRVSAASKYTTWAWYDYYELKSPEGVDLTSADVVRVSGAVVVNADGVTTEEMTTAVKKALAAEFGVTEASIMLVLEESRRLLGSSTKSRHLAATWSVEFTIVTSSSQQASMQAAVSALQISSSGLQGRIVTQLESQSGVSAVAANSVKVAGSTTNGAPAQEDLNVIEMPEYTTALNGNASPDINEAKGRVVRMVPLIATGIAIFGLW
jgi:uncharacterized surface protein with fasciclin (FAS1) repeats